MGHQETQHPVTQLSSRSPRYHEAETGCSCCPLCKHQSYTIREHNSYFIPASLGLFCYAALVQKQTDTQNTVRSYNGKRLQQSKRKVYNYNNMGTSHKQGCRVYDPIKVQP